MDRTKELFADFPEDKCLDTNVVFDKEILNRALNSTFVDLAGVACTCSETGCNDPRGMYKYNLSSKNSHCSLTISSPNLPL